MSAFIKGGGRRKSRIAVVFLLFVLISTLVVGTSYALWQILFVQTNENVIKSSCFEIKFSDANPIFLDEAYPISDSEGRNLTPYEFTLTNTCDSEARYQINLEILNDSTFTDLQYIKEYLNEKDGAVASLILGKRQLVEKTLDNATSAYKLKSGVLGAREVKTFHFRLWFDINTPVIDSVINKELNSKITVIASYNAPVNTRNMMMERNTSTNNYAFMMDSKRIIFRDSLVGVAGVEGIDISFNQDRSVMAYVDNSNPDLKTTYIEANGKIKFPVNSSSLFMSASVTTIEGLEYVDTSNVVNMNSMFLYCSSLTALDLTSFDTSKVTNMFAMFSNCSSLTSLDLTSFDTSQVTNMSDIFERCRSLTSIDLASFDTSKVTSMTGMFNECVGLISLNLASFDTSNVTDMSRMFGSCSKLVDIVYGNKFIHGANAVVENMYYNCSINKPTDSSWDGVI